MSDRDKNKNAPEDPLNDDPADDNDDEGGRRKGSRLGVEDLARVLKLLLDLKPIGQDTAERLLEVFLKLLNRREVLERILRSDFMRHWRDMQSEITEAIGIASQADVQDIKQRLDGVNQRLDKLQHTLDAIVVEVEEP